MIMIELQRQPATDARRKFRGYKREEPKIVRAAKVKEKRIFAELRSVWEQINRPLFQDEGEGGAIERYDRASAVFSRLDYEVHDIGTCLMLMSSEFDDRDIRTANKGILLSALVNSCKDDSPLIIENWHGEMGYVGFRNRKTMIVNGSLGEYCGNRMEEGLLHVKGDTPYGELGSLLKGGKIIVEGNVLNALDADCIGGKMRGGEIIVRGDAFGDIGPQMEGGKIEIFGTVTRWFVGEKENVIGVGMKGGEIHLHGEILPWYDKEAVYGDIRTSVIHGKIFHKGRLIVDK